MPRLPLCHGSAVALALLCCVPLALNAATPDPADLSGIWRLDDSSSVTPAAVEALLKHEAMREQPPRQPHPPGGTSAGTGQPADDTGPRHERMGGGGFGGHDGGMGGGHHGGHRHGDDKPSSDHAASAPTHYATPSWLDDDSVLMVQEDARALQLRLGSGTQLDLRFDHPAQQALNGSALVRSFRDDAGVHVEMRYADGSRLTQDWSLTADGRRLVLHQQWQLPSLERPVDFMRVYQRLN
ncbi:hypothetical protein [Dyella sp.]|uniref:hypothetical protein n=1 Tax=Dyella sp. TaxID=1869338 RepID=UPI003F7E11CB